ncbi:MAG: dynamin family protein, partial [Acetatifactor sp.]|nr:dynamin family protein [Acetatifactor sp.]
MREIFIKYNPYKVETAITIDGKPVKKSSALNKEDRRLQEWIEELPQNLLEECNTKSFRITFQGTILDYEDFQSVIADARNDGFEVECEYIPAKEVRDKEKAIEEIFAQIQAGPFEELKTPDVAKAFRNAQTSDFPVNVVATMSAGKSTLINALLREKLMPAKQEACTATITELKDSDADRFHAEAYDKNGNLIMAVPELTLEDMKALNDNPAVSMIKAEGDIPFVSSEDVS